MIYAFAPIAAALLLVALPFYAAVRAARSVAHAMGRTRNGRKR